MNKQALIYARTANDNESSIALQVNKACQLCLSKGATVVEIYLDRNMSGTTIERPGYKKAIDKIISGSINFVVATEPDRISRNPSVIYLFGELLKSKNVAVFYTDKPESSFDNAENILNDEIVRHLNAFYSRARFRQRRKHGKS